MKRLEAEELAGKIEETQVSDEQKDNSSGKKVKVQQVEADTSLEDTLEEEQNDRLQLVARHVIHAQRNDTPPPVYRPMVNTLRHHQHLERYVGQRIQHNARPNDLRKRLSRKREYRPIVCHYCKRNTHPIFKCNDLKDLDIGA